MTDQLIGLRTPHARHIEDRVHQHAVNAAALGNKPPLCGTFLPPKTTQRQVLASFAPAVICPRCIEVARRWYAASYFVAWDRVQRSRLLAALTHDLNGVS